MIPAVATVWNVYAQELSQALAAGNATEHTHRPALKRLLEGLRADLTATNEPRRVACGGQLQRCCR
ncbi:MAG: hypothetical protein IT204_22280 [Fimbriimonadaceae bacterium]|nr:hypothetical protein [Fimbriimonadaceae bacterium]